MTSLETGPLAMSSGSVASTAMTFHSTAASTTTHPGERSPWNNPYLQGSLALTITAVMTVLFSLLMVCHRLHPFHYCSLFLVEMAVGSLTTEAIIHLLPTLIITEKPQPAACMPAYFPRLATVTFGVCLLHALDTASMVFLGRRQSTTHALELRNEHATENADADAALPNIAEDINLDISDGASEGRGPSVKFAEDDDSQAERRRARGEEMPLGQADTNPGLCMRHGPFRICSIMSAGSVLHSFADGVAIGAAFVKSWESGLHLSLSVGMHDLAHKVADIAVLTASGFSLPAVVMLNCCYWASAFIGLFLSVPLSQKSENLRAWIMTIATAVFMYIALVTMSSMVRKNYLPKHLAAFIIGNCGMTTGYILIIAASVLGFYF